MILRLANGQFIGQSLRERQVGGLLYAEVSHTRSVGIPRHSHDTAHFVLILEGHYHTGAVVHGRTRTAPRLIFNPPGTTHEDRFVSERGRFFTMSIAPELLRRLDTRRIAIEQPVAFGTDSLSLLALKIATEFREADALSHVVLEGLGLELLGRTLRRARGGAKQQPPWLARAVEMMREHCCTDESVANIALAVGVHPFHLARTMRRFLGQSPGELMREWRVQKAASLLTRSTLSLSDIALTCGYADQSQFTRSFSRIIGTTPGAFRRASGAGRDNDVES